MCVYIWLFYEILTERNTRLDVYQSIAIAFTIWKISIFEKGERTEYTYKLRHSVFDFNINLFVFDLNWCDSCWSHDNENSDGVAAMAMV